MSVPLDRLFEFPYFDQYLELAFLEFEVVSLFEGRKAVFIGGGPLPLTPIAYAILEIANRRGLYLDLTSAIHLSASDEEQRQRLYRIVGGLSCEDYAGKMGVLSVDSSEEATSKAGKLIERLGLSKIISTLRADGCSMQIDSDVDVVVVASMAEPKERIMENLALQVGPDRELDIIVRSVEEQNLRQVLYKPLDMGMIEELESRHPRFRRIYTYTPPAGSRLINSFEVFRMTRIGSEMNEVDEVLVPCARASND